MAQILIIDDSAYQRHKARHAVETAGHELLEAANGSDGLKTAAATMPDCILLDLLMPKMRGEEVLQTLRDQGLDTPVIVLTADIQESTRQRCLELGAVAFINKPLQEAELLDAIQQALDVKGMELTSDQVDILKELINIGIGRAAGMLNTMLRSHVLLRIPFIEALAPSTLREKHQELGKDKLSTVQLAFKGPFSGTASLVFPAESAAKLVSVLTEDELSLSDLDSIRVGTLTEIGNIVLNGVMGVISNEIKQRIHYSVPRYVENPLQTLLTSSGPNADATVIWVQAQFTIEQHQIDGDIILLFEVGSLDVLLAALDQKVEA